MPPKNRTNSAPKQKKRKSTEDRSSEETEGDWEVEKVLSKKIYKGKVYYKLKWVGCTEPTWEQESHCQCEKLIKDYEATVKRKSADEDEDEWEVEKILDKRTTKNNKVEYLVKWKNWGGDHEWISEDDCLCINLIASYENPKLRKMWNFQGSNPNLWLDSDTVINYMKSYISRNKYRANLLKFEKDFPEGEKPLTLKEGVNIGPLSYKDHWYLVIILINHIHVNHRLLVGDPLNTLEYGSSDKKTHPVFKRLTTVYPRIPAKPLTMTPMDRSDVCGFYILKAFERALFLFHPKASWVPEEILFQCKEAEALRHKLRPDTDNEFSVALPVSGSYFNVVRCEFCSKNFHHDREEADKHIQKEHFN